MKIDRVLGSVALTAVTLGSSSLALAKGGTEIHIKMAATSADPHSRGMAQFNGAGTKASFNLNVQGLTPGAYELDLDGTSVATFTVDLGSGGAHLKLSAKKGSLAFDPRGHQLAVSSAGVAHLTSNFPLTRQEAMATTDIKAALENTGVQVGAMGVAHYRSKMGESRFSVEVEDLAPGSYDLFVGGVNQGSFVVDSMDQGEISFDTRLPEDDSQGDGSQDSQGDDDSQGLTAAQEDDGGGTQNLLTFDPRGQLVQVEQQGVVLLQITFPTQ